MPKKNPPGRPPPVGGANRSPRRNPSQDPVLESVSRRLNARQMISDASDFVKHHISRQPPVQRFFSFMPTMLTRLSPFHVTSRLKSADWPLVRLDSGDGNSWGRMQLVGEVLVIFDETVLFSLLSLMSRYRCDAFETTLEEMSRLTALKPTPANQLSTWRSLRRLAGTRIDLKLHSGKGKKRKALREMTGSILSFADYHRGKGNLQVVINPYFLEMYAESFVTNIDLNFRSGLKMDLSKALYRFYQGQYDLESSFDIQKLARAVNLDTDNDAHRLPAKMRDALRELKRKKYLESFDISPSLRVTARKARHTAASYESQIINPLQLDEPGYFTSWRR